MEINNTEHQDQEMNCNNRDIDDNDQQKSINIQDYQNSETCKRRFI